MGDPVRLLVCGSRYFRNRKLMRAMILGNKPDVIIHGGAPGADTLAGDIAKELGIPTEVYEAEWEKHGKAAGPIRNSRMLSEANPTRVLAFPRGEGRGTADMMRKAASAGLLVIVK